MSALDAMRAGLRRAIEAKRAEEEAERAIEEREGEPAQLSLLSPPSAASAAPAVPVDPNAPIVLTGEVTYVIFSGADTGFRVLRVQRDDLPEGEPRTAIVAGRSSTIRVGDRIRAVGRWEKGKHGLQVRADSIAPVDAVSDDGLARSLDGLVPWLGPGRAQRVVRELGGAEKAVAHLDRYVTKGTVLEHVASSPGMLLGSFTWLPFQVRLDLLFAWRDSRVEREVEARLASLDLPPALRARLIAKYGADAARIVLEEPYRLPLEVDGVGFLTADEVAGKVGVGRDSDQRMNAAALHVIREQADDGGHTVCAVGDVSKGMFDLFMKRPPPASFAEDPRGSVVRALERMVERKLLSFHDLGGASTGEKALYSLPPLRKAEQEIARGLATLIAADRPPLAYADVLDGVEASDGGDKKDRLTDEQLLAVRSVFDRGVVVVTGGPGVGKTHTCRRIVQVAMKLGLQVDLCAPTARAAKRLKESTGMDAFTIHRTLGAIGEGRFKFNADARLESDFVLVDEASMIDVELMASLITALRPGCRLVLVGDKDQLPPVGPGAPFRDVIASDVVPVARLTKIHRQASGSAIVRAAHGVLRGLAPSPSLDGDRADGCLHMVRKPTQETTAEAVVQIVMSLREELNVDPWDALVIAPMRKGECGVTALNARLQRAMNPPNDDRPEVLYGKAAKEGEADDRRIYRLGDRVRQTKNDYDRNVVNGDVGRIVQVFSEKKRGKGDPWLAVDFGEGVGVVKYDGAQLGKLVLSYCGTVHGNQGGQGPAVVLALVDQHYVMLTRTLLYTAITRAQHACIVVGSRRAVETAARNARDDARRTALPKLLKEPSTERAVASSGTTPTTPARRSTLF